MNVYQTNQFVRLSWYNAQLTLTSLSWVSKSANINNKSGKEVRPNQQYNSSDDKLQQTR